MKAPTRTPFKIMVPIYIMAPSEEIAVVTLCGCLGQMEDMSDGMLFADQMDFTTRELNPDSDLPVRAEHILEYGMEDE